LYGAECIVCGTDGTEFGCEWTSKALAKARNGEDKHAQISHRNADAMMSRLAKIAQRETVAAQSSRRRSKRVSEVRQVRRCRRSADSSRIEFERS
jgi:hypothetical protein